MHAFSIFRFSAAIVVLVSARAAHASCSITGLKPDNAMLPTMDVGQEFTFVASGDCVTLRFHVADSKLTKIPKSGPAGSDKEATYKVVLTEREWNMVSDGRDELTWSISGVSASTGDIEREMQTNDIDHDLHFKLAVSEADATLAGEAATDEFGASVSSAGDVNGDEIDDVLIGAPGKWDGKGVKGRGAAYVVMGPVSGDVDLAVASFIGEAEGDEAGESVSAAGDVNNDGYDDLLIGSRYNDSETGAAYLMYGPVTGRATAGEADVKLVGEGAGDWAGFSVSGTGNINADEDDYDDILVGSFWHGDTSRTGAAYLVLGPVTGPTFELSKADAKLLGPPRDARGLGVNVARAGDVDGDGSDDLAVGTDWNDEFEGPRGVSYTLSYTLSTDKSTELDGVKADPGLVEFVPESANDSASAIAGAGDVNGDDYDDMLIGASDNMSGGMKAGKAYLFLGPFIADEADQIELADATAKFVGENPGDRAGDHVAGAGDVNADGFDDILIGACGNNDGAGATYLVLGPITGTEETKDLSRSDVKLTGEAADDCAGFGVSSAGDVDGDELDDVLVGAPGNSDGAGAAYVFGGATLSLLIAGSP